MSRKGYGGAGRKNDLPQCLNCRSLLKIVRDGDKQHALYSNNRSPPADRGDNV